jgi:predicted RNase H-like HicB family nuclease
MKFTVILGPEGDGGYSVTCPAIPGCVSQGDSLDEAIENVKEAILGCLEASTAEGVLPTRETHKLIAEEIEAVLKDRAEEGLPLTIETREVDVESGVAV